MIAPPGDHLPLQLRGWWIMERLYCASINYEHSLVTYEATAYFAKVVDILCNCVVIKQQ